MILAPFAFALFRKSLSWVATYVLLSAFLTIISSTLFLLPKLCRVFKFFCLISARASFALNLSFCLPVTASLFTSQQKTDVSKNLLKLAKPLTPTIDQEVIQRLRQQGVFLESQLQNFPIYMIVRDRSQIERIIEIGTELEPTSSPSPSPSLNPSPNATSAVETNNE